MLAAMSDWNLMTVVIVVCLFGLWKLELIATLMNLKAFPESVPAAMEGWLTAEKLDQARDYLRVNARFGIVQGAFSLTTLLVFWALGGFPWLDALSRSLAPNELTAGLVFVSLLVLGQGLLDLPFAWYDTFVIEESFGFNRATPRTFVMDRVKGLLLAGVLGLPLLAAVLWIFARVPHAWLWAWAVVTVFQLVLTYLAPTLILPLFNKFTPMADGPLKQAIENLGERSGFPLSGVFVMDGSKRSTKANAFFTGFGKRKKIALYDTLIGKSSTDELLGVLAHEIGHFRCGHIRQRLVVGILQMAAIFYLLGIAIDLLMVADTGTAMEPKPTARTLDLLETARKELRRLIEGARIAHRLGLKVNAGHGINLQNIRGILDIPYLDTLNIGHSLVARAVEVGMKKAVWEMRDAMSGYRGGQP